MADRGILFSPLMVQALLAGRKTQTRRLLSLRGYPEFSEFGPSDTLGYDWHFRRADGCWCDFRSADLPLRIAVGDRLYVREAWRVDAEFDHVRASLLEPGLPVFFDADGDPGDHLSRLHILGRRRAAMHMVRWASRITLEVTEVRVERLCSISEADAEAEGFPGAIDCPIEPSGWYSGLWDMLNSEEGTRWEDNPWVVAVSFTARNGNIDVKESLHG